MQSAEPKADEFGWCFEHTYLDLPSLFYAHVKPTRPPKPQIVIFNELLAENLGLKSERLAQRPELLAGGVLPPGAKPIAQAYAGHQFGYFTLLGDGRAILLGEHISPRGERFDVHLKGAGLTPFSRRGDGKAALGPMLREYLVSEAMHALGIPSSRSLAVIATGEEVQRESLLPGAVLVRLAASHIRVGTFEYAARQGGHQDLKALADYTLARHYPELQGANNPYLALLQSVLERQAGLIAKWQMVGFIHGVMNTDNMTVSGETLDYGPCAFMEAYHPATVFSSIDHYGRYAFAKQPVIAQWNLARFAEALLPLIDREPPKAIAAAQEALASFPEIYKAHWLAGMRAKLGLLTSEDEDSQLIADLLDWMQRQQADYTNTFRSLLPIASGHAAASVIADEVFRAWVERWQARLARQPQTGEESLALMRANNPAYTPRNHRVAKALKAAEENNDFSVMHRLLEVLARPYDDQAENCHYQQPALPEERVCQTFCGT